jgi:hypothetical protein
MIDCRARYEAGTLRLLSNRVGLDEGELVTVQIERGRSGPSHRHQFAWVRTAWENLPESLMFEDWARNEETLRKRALIECGFFHQVIVDCHEKNVAKAVAEAIRAAKEDAYGYAVCSVREGVAVVRWAESQKIKAMGRDKFQASKAAILEWVAGKLGVPPEELRRAA